VFFPFIPRKEPDKFVLQQENNNNDKYLEAEAVFKRADAESNEFADSVLKVCPFQMDAKAHLYHSINFTICDCKKSKCKLKDRTVK